MPAFSLENTHKADGETIFATVDLFGVILVKRNVILVRPSLLASCCVILASAHDETAQTGSPTRLRIALTTLVVKSPRPASWLHRSPLSSSTCISACLSLERRLRSGDARVGSMVGGYHGKEDGHNGFSDADGGQDVRDALAPAWERGKSAAKARARGARQGQPASVSTNERTLGHDSGVP